MDVTAVWLDEPLRFSHYRAKDQVEVDLVIEQGRNVWGIEVKKAASIQTKDVKGYKPNNTSTPKKQNVPSV